MASSPIRVGLFGGLSVTPPGGAATHLAPQQPGALLAYLSLFPHRPHPREELVEVLWPDSEVEDPRQMLRRNLHALRALLSESGIRPDELILANRSSLQLVPGVLTDVAGFDR